MKNIIALFLTTIGLYAQNTNISAPSLLAAFSYTESTNFALYFTGWSNEPNEDFPTNSFKVMQQWPASITHRTVLGVGTNALFVVLTKTPVPPPTNSGWKLERDSKTDDTYSGWIEAPMKEDNLIATNVLLPVSVLCTNL